jgi:hypothetical protein
MHHDPRAVLGERPRQQTAQVLLTATNDGLLGNVVCAIFSDLQSSPTSNSDQA